MDHQASRPRSKSTFSFRSSKSEDSGHSKPKLDLHETDAEKRKSRMKEGSKANPNSAINEAQPAAVAAQAKNTIGNLRALEFKDQDGNVITDPDRSNPSRPRFERPLDTIRSFERAVEGTYGRPRTSFAPSEAPDFSGFASRRTSYFGGMNDTPGNRMSQVTGYYGSRTPRPDSYYENNHGPSRNRQRMHSEPMMHSGRPRHPSIPSNEGVYPNHGYHQSHDTVGTGYTNGSDSTGPWANSTDPSSENSSIDRMNAAKTEQEGSYNTGGYNMGGYGIPGPVQGTIPEEYGTGSHGPMQPQQSPGGPRGDKTNPLAAYFAQQNSQPNGPPVPAHGQPQAPQVQRKLIKLSTDGSAAPAERPALSKQNSEKRKSWFKRRFSKGD